MVQRHLARVLAGASGAMLGVLLLAGGSARAQRGGDVMPQPAPQTPDQQAMARFPQPVRVGDLAGRLLLAPTEAQPVLGRVVGVVRAPDGPLSMLVDRGGLLGLGSTPVTVPVQAVALLGELVGLMDITPAAFRALPRFDPARAAMLGPDETIRVGLTAPFH